MKNMKIKIYYMNNKYEKSYENNELIIDILKNCSVEFKKNIEELYFIENGNRLLLNDLEKKKLKADLYKNKIIFAFDLIKVKKKNIWKLNNIICPECKNLALMTYNDELITLNCSNNHSFKNLSLNEFIESQHSDDIINCDICHKSKNIYNEEFYLCSCNKKLCSICIIYHNKFHEYIKYKNKFDYCYKHKIEFDSFCNKCNCNVCCTCECEDHYNHKISLLKQYRPKERGINEIKNSIDELNNKIKIYKKEIKILKEIFNGMITNFMNNLDNHMKINEYIYNSLDNLNNYHKIKNVTSFNCKKLIKEINTFLNLEIRYKFTNLIEKFYEKNIPFNQMDLSYCPRPEKKIKLFSDEFFEKNKNNCHLIIKDKIEDFFQYYECKKRSLSELIKVSLISENPITDMKNMFYDCDSLKILKNNNFDTSKVTNMSNMFNECRFLTTVKGIKNVEKVTKMNNMFKGCLSLTNISDISNWNLYNLNDISYMFYGCSKLTKISDYLFWDTSKIKNMSYLFQGCSVLENLPDISNWKTNEVTDMSHMFKDCLKIKILPDISKWNINKVNDISYMFDGCVELESLPDISEWDTSNVINMNHWLYGCESLKSLPDISKWNTNNVTKMNSMFYYCKSLSDFPDISKWKTSKLTDISQMFYKCQSLKPIPSIHKWNNFNHLKRDNYDFGCNSLIPKALTIKEKNISSNISRRYTVYSSNSSISNNKFNKISSGNSN